MNWTTAADRPCASCAHHRQDYELVCVNKRVAKMHGAELGRVACQVARAPDGECGPGAKGFHVEQRR